MRTDSERRTLVEDAFRQSYGGRQPTLWVQAPGRVDLMGSHTDYNEGYVLTMPIDRNTWIAARPRTDRIVNIRSLNVEGSATFSLDHIEHDATVPWSNYVRGVADVLQREGHALSGFDGLIHSTVPFGSGLSSSAALEVATAILFNTMGQLDLDPVTIALLTQRAENEFVGVNCGILDQYTSSVGRTGHALLLDCRDLSSRAAAIHPDVRVVICDTRAERSLSNSAYTERRSQCETGAAQLATVIPTVKTLRDVSPEQLETHKELLDETVYRRCRFIIEENQRVLALADALPTNDRAAIGALTAASFAGARDLYEIVSPEMVAMMEAMLGAPGVIGARQAGAGFGGCMVAFVERESTAAFATHVERAYTEQTGITPRVYPVQSATGAGVIEANL